MAPATSHAHTIRQFDNVASPLPHTHPAHLIFSSKADAASRGVGGDCMCILVGGTVSAVISGYSTGPARACPAPSKPALPY